VFTPSDNLTTCDALLKCVARYETKQAHSFCEVRLYSSQPALDAC